MTGPGIPCFAPWRLPISARATAFGFCGALILGGAALIQAQAQAQAQAQVQVPAQVPAQVQAEGDQIVGRPGVIDGDTLDFAGTHLDLFGIDAPEAEQSCGAAGQTWNCGLEARWALLNRVGRHWVTCVPHDHPPGGNRRAVCYLAGVGQHDLGAWLVGSGWALADREAAGEINEAYARDEAAARRAGMGLWRGAFEAPWDWRRRRAGQAP